MFSLIPDRSKLSKKECIELDEYNRKNCSKASKKLTYKDFKKMIDDHFNNLTDEEFEDFLNKNKGI